MRLMIRALYDDVRIACRSLLKQPRFVSIAAFTLALGIGSVTAIFSVVNGVLLKPLPYPDADRLVNVWSNAPGLGFDQFPLSPDLYYFFRGETKSFDEMTVFRRRDANLTENNNPEVVPVAETAASWFGTLRIVPAIGQVFTASHDVQGAPLVAVISHRLWQRRFAGDAGVVGRTVQIDGETTTILGVLPRELDDNESPDAWIPARFDPAHPPTGNFGWNVSARLKPGSRIETAEAEFVPLVKRLTDGQITGPDYRAFLTNGKYRVLVHSMREDIVGDLRQPLWILLGTVGFVLLIACANVANLFLIRAEGRQREVAVRAALGATRPALIRKQLVEAGVLATIGGGLGVLIAALAVPALVRAAPSTIPRLGAVGLDPLVLLVAAVATAVAALIFGIVPAFRYTRFGTLAALRHGGRGATVDRARHRGRKLLVVIQTAMTLVLLVGSGLLVRSFSRMLHADLGFDPHNVLTFRVALPASDYKDSPRVLDFDRRLLESLAALPGVDAVGAASSLPMASGAPGTAFSIDGQPTPPGQLPPIIHYKFTAPGYVEAMGLRLLRGRAFDRRDLAEGARDVLVNKALADKFWPGQEAIGKRLRPSGDADATKAANSWYTVVGVVSSELHDGFRREPPVVVYWAVGAPYGGGPMRTLAYTIKGPGAGRDADAARKAVWALDPRLPVAVVRTMDEIVARSIVPFTFTMLTLGIAAAMALVLGTVGLYGVLSYAVSLRVREIGVRIALGAQPSRVMRAIVGQGLGIVAAGLVAGVAGAYGLTRYLGGLLYNTPPLDVTTFAATSAALFAVAALASYLPARRAASVSPLESLRAE
jgi:putative ABC transport system permease protein